MIINLKTLEEQIEGLEMLERDPENIWGQTMAEEVCKFLKEMRDELDTGGESIVELDKPRMAAIQERDNYVNRK